MISDWELWACAQHMLARHGAEADERIADRIDAMRSAGDAAGLATWRAIADRAKRLRSVGDGAVLQ